MQFSFSKRFSCLVRIVRTAAFLCVLYAGIAHAAGALFEIDSAQIAATIENYFLQAQQAVSSHDIRLARQQVSMVSFKMEKYVQSIDKKSYDTRLSTIKTAIKRVVDSLVQVNLLVVKNNGQAAGIDFRRECAAAGLSETELAPVDEAIANAASTDERPRVQPASQPVIAPAPIRQPPPVQPVLAQQQATAPVKEPPRPQQSVGNGTKFTNAAPPEKKEAVSPTTPSFAPAPAAAPVFEPQPKVSFAEETPSVRQRISPEESPRPQTPDFAAKTPAAPVNEPTYRGTSDAAANVAKVNGLLRENKFEEAWTVFNIYQENLRQNLPPQDFQQLKATVENAYSQDQSRRSRAAGAVQTIDDLVDQNRSAEAFALFRASREDLKSILAKSEVDRLETKVGRAYVEFGKAQGAANARARDIRALITSGNVEEAAASFEKQRAELTRCLSKEAFEELRRAIDAAIDAVKDQKKQTLICVRDIRSLINEGQGFAAAAKFADNKAALQRSMDEKPFAALTQEVTKAKTDFYIRQTNAQADLVRIDSLIAAKRIESAYAAFEKSKETLRRDCADDKRFFDCKDRVVKAYDEMRQKLKTARHSAKNIETLVRKQKGFEAHVAFQVDAELLREGLEAQAFKKLEETVGKAYVDYGANVAAARLMAQDIESLLAKGQIERAYEAYKKAQHVFDRFLASDRIIDELEQKIKQAYAHRQKQKRWAQTCIRDIQWLMDHTQGNRAYEQFVKAKPELSSCIEPKQLLALDSAVSRAEKKYLTEKALVEKKAVRIGGLIDQKHFEEAYALFTSLRKDLETYLPEQSFTNLRNETTNAYEEYEGKKAKAREYAKQLTFLAERKRMQEANNGFQSNRAALKLYLSAQEFGKLETMIIGKSVKTKVKGSSKK